MRSTALVRIPVGVVVERRSAVSVWTEFLWRPVSILVGEPSAAPWTIIGARRDATLFYAGTAPVELHRTETTSYRENLASERPSLWVALRPVTTEPPYELLGVTADPAEGEAFTDAGRNLVEPVPMPSEIIGTVGRFVRMHHVERPFQKRRRQPAEGASLRQENGR
jgi:hypothetical protein